MINKKQGFTLIELLVVVLIIGVLTAIALPKYQTAVDKSRYGALMPIAKSIANAQEAYLMTTGKYSSNLEYLDVQLPNNPIGNEATLSDGTTVTISDQDEYDYVKITKSNLENNYIIYQSKSDNFPGEIHCEAKEGSDRAARLCQGMGGEWVEGSLTAGYETYVLEGTGTDVFASAANPNENGQGVEGCDSYPCVKECSSNFSGSLLSMANGAFTSGGCQATYQEDGSFVEKQYIESEENGIQGYMFSSANEKGIESLLCNEDGSICPMLGTFSSDGNITFRRCYSAIGSDGRCTSYDFGWDSSENEGTRVVRHCQSFDGTTCVEWGEEEPWFW